MIAESKQALPVVIVYAVIVLLAGGAYFCSATDYTVELPLVGDTRLYVHHSTLAQMLMLALCVIAMLLLTTRHPLIRIYSRIVSCAYIALNVMAVGVLFQFQPPAPWGDDWGIIHCLAVQLCLILFYILLFNTYQKPKSQGTVLIAFACIGIASIFFIQIVFFVPLLWLLMARNMMVYGTRMLAASTLGVMLPYWFIGAVCIFTGKTTTLLQHLTSIAVFVKPDEWLDVTMSTSLYTAVTVAFMLLLAVTGIVHFTRTSYKDSIRVRMMFEVIISLTVTAFIFIALQPQHVIMLLNILIINASVLIGHYIALTGTRWTNASFFLLIALTLAITAFNIYGCAH